MGEITGNLTQRISAIGGGSRILQAGRGKTLWSGNEARSERKVKSLYSLYDERWCSQLSWFRVINLARACRGWRIYN